MTDFLSLSFRITLTNRIPLLLQLLDAGGLYIQIGIVGRKRIDCEGTLHASAKGLMCFRRSGLLRYSTVNMGAGKVGEWSFYGVVIQTTVLQRRFKPHDG